MLPSCPNRCAQTVVAVPLAPASTSRGWMPEVVGNREQRSVRHPPRLSAEGPGTEIHGRNRKGAEDYGNSTASAVEFVADHRSALERGQSGRLESEGGPTVARQLFRSAGRTVCSVGGRMGGVRDLSGKGRAPRAHGGLRRSAGVSGPPEPVVHSRRVDARLLVSGGGERGAEGTRR